MVRPAAWLRHMRDVPSDDVEITVKGTHFIQEDSADEIGKGEQDHGRDLGVR